MTVKMKNSEVDGVSVVALDGRIVLGEESNSLREKFKSLTDDGKKKIVLNMANIEYIDGAGVGAGHLDAISGAPTYQELVSDAIPRAWLPPMCAISDRYDLRKLLSSVEGSTIAQRRLNGLGCDLKISTFAHEACSLFLSCPCS